MTVLPAGERGVTLIEMIVVIVIVAMAVPVMLTNFATLSLRAIRSEAVADAAMHAGRMMEEITARPFADPQDTKNTDLGANTGDAGYDDVDDYEGYFAAAAAFNVSVAVKYANLSGTNWTTVTGPTDFKRVTVTVTSGRHTINSTMETIVSPY